MASTINATPTSSGLIQTADNSGVLALQTGGTTGLTVNAVQGVQALNCIGVGNSTPSTSGAGITFPATQSASSDANTLDDYEEGTWTATLIGGSTAGASPTQTGYYTKIGNLVYITIYFGGVSTSGAVGQLQITGLPFTSNANETSNSFAFFYGFSSVTATATGFMLENGQTKVVGKQNNTSGNWSDWAIVAGSGIYVRFSMSYRV